jgi:ferrochelatase
VSGADDGKAWRVDPLPKMDIEAGGSDALGVLLMAYGTPRSLDEVEAYYTHIRRGNAPTPEQLADLVRRYEAIGGVSPLAERTEAQRQAISAALAQRGVEHLVVLGQKHAEPYVEDGVARLAAAGVQQVVGLVLAPHWSGFSVGQYHARASAAAAEHGMDYEEVGAWHLEPTYLDFLAGAVREAQATLPADHKVLFTAHSLPERVLVDDPYPGQLRESATAVAQRVGLPEWAGWGLAWQSAGRTPEPWRGPDILEVLRDLAETGRSDGVLVCAQGFVSDHLEVVYDLDIEAKALADDLGLAFARTRSLNDDAAVMGALADRVVAAVAAVSTDRHPSGSAG